MGETVTGHSKTFDRAGWLILAGMTLLTAAMRFYRLGSVPAGLHFDEAFNGLDSLNLLLLPPHRWPAFFEGNSGREALFVWLTSVAHAFFGPSIWTARSVSALSGTLLTPALAWLGWNMATLLGVRRRQQFSLWCAAVVLALLWSQIFSRFGIRAILYVLIQTLLWAALWRAWKRPPPAIGAWLLTGSLAGLCLYTYLPARLLPLVILPLLVAVACTDFQRLKKHLPGLICGLASVLLLIAPMALYFIQDQFAFFNRIEQVADLEGSSVLSNLSGALRMFVLSGDIRYRNNLSARPALDPLLALPFLVGVGLTLYRFWRLGSIFLLAGMAVNLLPTVLSSNAPNFLRSIGVLPFIALFTALGFESTVRFLERLRSAISGPALATVWAAFAASIALTSWTYFGVWASKPQLFYDFHEGFTRLARHIVEEREATIYINTHGGLRHPAVSYLLTQRDASARFYDGQECLPVALAGPVRHFYLANEEFRSRLQASSFFPQVTSESTVIADSYGQPWLSEIKNSAGAPTVFPQMRRHEVHMADGISLAGYSLSQERIHAGNSFHLQLYWRASQRPTVDYTTFIHLVQLGEDGSTTRVAGFDRRPGDGNCPTMKWLPGEIIVDDAVLKMPKELPETELFLAIGFYSIADGSRLPIQGSDDAHFLLGPFTSTE